MLDLQHLPANSLVTFFSASSIGVPWHKSRHAQWLYIHMIGSGGGGGGGRTGAALSARGGGGGGGPSGNFCLLVPAAVFPDMLRVRCGYGGAGGNANSAGTQGGLSALWVENEAGEAYFSITGASGGGAGLTTAGGAGGSNGLVGLGAAVWMQYANSNGFDVAGAGGAHTGAVGNNSTDSYLAIAGIGGAGGAGVGTSGTNFAGGSVPAYLPHYSTINGGTAGGGAGDAGPDQITGFNGLPLMLPGAGGGSNNAGTGGAGGRGGRGCGGGGGGGGLTGGAGGRGGDGFGFIVEF